MNRADLQTYIYAAVALISALALVGMTSGCGETKPSTGPCLDNSIRIHNQIGSIESWQILCTDTRAKVVQQGSPIGYCVCPGGAK